MILIGRTAHGQKVLNRLAEMRPTTGAPSDGGRIVTETIDLRELTVETVPLSASPGAQQTDPDRQTVARNRLRSEGVTPGPVLAWTHPG